MYTNHDLESFGLVLINKGSSDKYVYSTLSKLSAWSPVKNQIVASGIIRCILPLTKLSNEIGIISTSIVKKWKKIFLNDSYYREFNLLNDITTSDDRSLSQYTHNNSNQNKLQNLSSEKVNFSDEDIESFCFILNNVDSPDKYKYKVLMRLNDWNPVKSQIITSGIGKSIYKLSKVQSEIGSLATRIVNKWKTIYLNDFDSGNNTLKTNNKTLSTERNVPLERSKYSKEDIESICLLLSDEDISEKCICKVLLKLDYWVPVKSQIIATGLGKCLSKLSKVSGDVGTISSKIINKWKVLFDIQYQTEQRTTNKVVDANKFVAKCTPKRENTHVIREVPPKKKCLSLQDYYRRKPSVCPEPLSSNEISSESGISFLDSITVKVASSHKTKPRGPLSIYELNAGLCDSKRAQRQDVIIHRDENITTKSIEADDMFKPIPCNPRVYIGKKRATVNQELHCDKYFHRSIANPPSLLKQCQSVLLMYKEHIEEVLWTPRELLADILSAFSPQQLLQFESFNPQFIEDNEQLWRQHCMKRAARIGSSANSWRECYLELGTHDEEKMKRSLSRLKSKMDMIKKDEDSKKIKMLSNVRSNPSVRRFSHWNKESQKSSNPVIDLLKKRYRQMHFNYK